MKSLSNHITESFAVNESKIISISVDDETMSIENINAAVKYYNDKLAKKFTVRQVMLHSRNSKLGAQAKLTVLNVLKESGYADMADVLWEVNKYERYLKSDKQFDSFEFVSK